MTKFQVLWNLEKETPGLGGIELSYFWFDIGDSSVRNTFQNSTWRLQTYFLRITQDLKSYTEDLSKSVNLASN